MKFNSLEAVLLGDEVWASELTVEELEFVGGGYGGAYGGAAGGLSGERERPMGAGNDGLTITYTPSTANSINPTSSTQRYQRDNENISPPFGSTSACPAVVGAGTALAGYELGGAWGALIGGFTSGYATAEVCAPPAGGWDSTYSGGFGGG
jgi:hypothetical protein